jgi:hypothetical protein
MSGHGWVKPLAGGQVVARCGGPGMCKACQQEAADLYRELEARGDELRKTIPPEGPVAGLRQQQEIYSEQMRIMDLLPEAEQSALMESLES